MYCPNCGFNNQAEIKFCTRCGTNLNVVSEALSGKSSTQPQVDERMVRLLKDYYQGRRASLVGGLTLPVGLAMLMAMFVTGFPQHLIVIGLLGLGLTIYGAIAGIWGIGHWIGSTSEMKALRIATSQNALPPALRDELGAAPVADERTPQYATDPIEPASVTEHTTRQLDGSASEPSLKIQSH